jgi:hypothetical protein
MWTAFITSTPSLDEDIFDDHAHTPGACVSHLIHNADESGL